MREQLLEELPGILNWSIEGLKRLSRRGMFEEVNFMKEAIEELRLESNPIEGFFKEHIEADTHAKWQVEKSEIYNKYDNWCRINGNKALSSIKFGQALYQKYNKFTEKKSQCSSTGKRIWKNIRYIDNKNEPIKQDIHWQDTPLDKTASPSTIAAQGDISNINWED